MRGSQDPTVVVQRNMNQGPPAYNDLVNDDEEIESRAPTQQPMAGQVQPTPGYPTFQQQGMIPGVGQPAAFYMQPYQPTIMPYPNYVIQTPKLPPEFVPNDYLAITLIIMIPCAILNITTLFFSIPAFICSLMAFEKKSNGIQYYAAAKSLGLAALILDIITLFWYFGLTIIIVGRVTAI